MKYFIEGADKTTGDDRRIIISAESASEAQNKAGTKGILVSTVQARESEPDQPITEPSREDILDELEEHEVTGGLTPKTPQRGTRRPSPPEYNGLKYASNMLGFLGAFSYVIAVFAFLVYADDGAGGEGFFIFLSLLVVGAIQAGMVVAGV